MVHHWWRLRAATAQVGSLLRLYPEALSPLVRVPLSLVHRVGIGPPPPPISHLFFLLALLLLSRA